MNLMEDILRLRNLWIKSYLTEAGERNRAGSHLHVHRCEMDSDEISPDVNG